MRKWIKEAGKVALFCAVVFGAYAFFAPGTEVAAKGKGGGNPPPACGCAQVFVLPNGSVCTLQSCGSDCVYVCTLPSP